MHAIYIWPLYSLKKKKSYTLYTCEHTNPGYFIEKTTTWSYIILQPNMTPLENISDGYFNKTFIYMAV